VDNIKMDLREIGWDGRDWIDLAQDRDHNIIIIRRIGSIISITATVRIRVSG
jgi:hypothetical protein